MRRSWRRLDRRRRAHRRRRRASRRRGQGRRARRGRLSVGRDAVARFAGLLRRRVHGRGSGGMERARDALRAERDAGPDCAVVPVVVPDRRLRRQRRPDRARTDMLLRVQPGHRRPVRLFVRRVLFGLPVLDRLPRRLLRASAGSLRDDGLLVQPRVADRRVRRRATPQPTSSIPPSTWGTTARACGTTPTTGGCSGGALCVASPPAPFGKVCVSQPGMAACPAGAYSVAHVFYGGVSDSRSCSGCSCGTPTGTSCTGAQVDAFSMNTGACGGTETPLAFGSCATVGVPILGEQETTAPTADNGTCSPSGGQPSGSGVPATPTTLCCTP